MTDLLFVDCETSGLKPSEGAVMLSIAAIARGSDGSEQLFEAMILPTQEQWLAASQEALAVNGITWEDLENNGQPADQVDARFAEWLDGLGDSYQHVGQNPSFDRTFIAACLPLSSERFVFSSSKVHDIRNLYDMVRQSGRSLVSLPKLSYRSGKNISVALGVPPEDDVHTAMGGAQAVMRNFYALREAIYGK